MWLVGGAHKETKVGGKGNNRICIYIPYVLNIENRDFVNVAHKKVR